jgi:phenylalanyl-tRNA synthetase alpha chain
LRATGTLPIDQRAAFGRQANAIKTGLTAAYEDRVAAIRQRDLEQTLTSGALDVTLPGRSVPSGGMHVIKLMFRDIRAIWAEMGFQVYRSYEVVTDDDNFTHLNMPPYHPARDMQDTFYTTEPGIILRGHTSAGQVRVMREYGANGSQPVRVILPGMCYRRDDIDASHGIQFMQTEGLAVGRNIRLSDLKGCLTVFAQRLFGADREVRFRASYFPFTEPSLETDMQCAVCRGRGCNTCGYDGWLELGGSGMVHPNVLRNGGYDPHKWSGFAFGWGVDRMAMLRYSIQDIRYFWDNDLRFLDQF